jgi:hypothetical protein
VVDRENECSVVCVREKCLDDVAVKIPPADPVDGLK